MQKNDTSENKLNVYEIGYLLVPTIAEENVPNEVQIIKNLIESKGASFITEDFPKLRSLAYTMVKAIGSQQSKYDKGYFGWIKFEVQAAAIPVLKSELDKDEHILRYMLISTVRENTMVAQKVVFRPASDKAESETEEGAQPEESPASEEELDKTIDNLVVE